MQPMNYNIAVASPFESALKGYQTGTAIQQQGQQQQQAVMQQEQQRQMQGDLAALSQKPDLSASDLARMTIKYPQLGEHFKNVWAPLSEEQKQNAINSATQVVSAINAGQIDIAKGLLQKQEDAAKNSGDQRGADSARAMSQIIDANPGAAKMSGAMFLSSAMGADKFAAVSDALLKTPVEVQKLSAEANNLPTKQALENQNAFQDIETKKLNRDISVLDSQIKSADSETKRGQLELERDKLVTERDGKQQERQVATQAALTGVTQQMETVDRILNSDMMKADANWTGQGTLIYRMRQFSPLSNEVKDLENLVDTLKSQQFLSNLSQLKAQGGTLGQVTEKEGERLEKALTSLETTQSQDAFRTAVTTVKKSLQNIQGQIVAQGKLPTTNDGAGGAYVMKHPTYGTVTEATVNQLLTSNKGATREQVLEFLKSSGGK